jgi:hypothetical protein
MKRKPTSMMDFLKTVQCVEHPKLKAEHCHFLGIVALHANYETGRNSHPGFAAIAKAMKRSNESVRRYARHCEDLGLIEVTRKPDGKNIATVWRVCLEHPAFVDLKDVDLKRLGPQEAGDRSTREGVKVHKSSAIGPQVDVDPPATPTTNPPTTPTLGGEEGRVGEEPVGHGRDIEALLDATIKELKRIYAATEDKTMPLLRSRDKGDVDKDRLRDILKKTPQAEILAAFTEARSQGIWQGWKFPLQAFFREFDDLLEAAKRKAARKPVTDDDVKRAGERSAALRNEIFGDGIKGDDEPGPEGLF